MKTLNIEKTVKPARICQNLKHWREYIKEAVIIAKQKNN